MRDAKFGLGARRLPGYKRYKGYKGDKGYKGEGEDI
jgi:hypothetical protein